MLTVTLVNVYDNFFVMHYQFLKNHFLGVPELTFFMMNTNDNAKVGYLYLPLFKENIPTQNLQSKTSISK